MGGRRGAPGCPRGMPCSAGTGLTSARAGWGLAMHPTRPLAGPQGRGSRPSGRRARRTRLSLTGGSGQPPRIPTRTRGVSRGATHGRGAAQGGCTWQAPTYLSWSPGGWWLRGEQGLRGHRHPPEPPTSVSFRFSHPGLPAPAPPGRAQCACAPAPEREACWES